MDILRTLLLSAVTLTLAAGCRPGSDPVAGGSSSEGEAKITGIARYEDGRPARGARIRLRPSDWVDTAFTPGSGDGMADARTDAAGRFTLFPIAPGEYALEVGDSSGNASLIRPTVDRKTATLRVEAVLSPAGAVRGILAVDRGAPPSYVRVLGLMRTAQADTLTGEFLLPFLPAGLYTLAFGPRGPKAPVDTLPDVEVIPKDTVDLGGVDRPEDLGDWPHRRRIEAMPAGLGSLSASLVRVPVLLTLDSTFPFAEAGTHGEDIRFSREDGRQLRFGFRGWNPARSRAEVWVQLDSLRAGSGSHGIWIHWGKPGAASRSKGYDVFHINQGFRGVWHLTAGNGAEALAVQDSSSNRNHGRAAAASPWADTGSLSAFGSLRLDSANAAVTTTKSYHSPAAFTLSVWFRTNTRSGGRLGGLGDARNGRSLLHDRVVWMDSTGRLAFGVRTGLDTGLTAPRSVLTSSGTYNDGRWHQVTARLSPESGQHLFVDGEPVASDSAVKSAGDYAGWWRIGLDDMEGWEPRPGAPAWTGLMQEFWVIHRAMDAEWIRFHHAATRPRLP